MPDILVVDRDLRSVRAMIPRIHTWAYTVDVAETLQQAIEMLDLHACGIVILAVYVDDFDASDAIATIYQANPKVRIVAVGDRSSLELERTVRLSKVFYYMIRPIDFDELKSVVGRALKKAVN